MSVIIQQEREEFNIHQETASEVIRSYGKQFEQIIGRYSNGENGRCVIGVLSSYFGWDGKSKDERSVKYHKIVDDYLEDYGLSQKDLIELNDSGKTFDEISDIIERCRLKRK